MIQSTARNRRYKVYAVPLSVSDESFTDEERDALAEQLGVMKGGDLIPIMQFVNGPPVSAAASPPWTDENEKPATDRALTVVSGMPDPEEPGRKTRGGVLFLGSGTKKVPLSDTTNLPAAVAADEEDGLSRAEQIRRLEARLAQEKAAAKAEAAKAEAAKAEAAAAAAEMEASAREAAAKEVAASAAQAMKARADKLFEQRAVFEGDGAVPCETLPPLTHDADEPKGACVLIPPSKYPKFHETSSSGAKFLGWVGQIQGYDQKRKVAKVKINGDRGFEKLPVAGTHKYAIASLVRLA